MRYEPDDYNNEECLIEHIEWCQKFFGATWKYV